MSFWSQTSDPNRRFRTNPRSGSLFTRESSPDTDMFFESPTGFSNFPRSNLAERLGNSVFDDFPSRRTMHAFHNADQPFGSLHRRPHPNWVSSDGVSATGSRESSPTLEARGGGNVGGPGLARHQFFQRADSIPVRVTHESRHGSRSSTPESNGSGNSHASSSSHSRPQSSSAEASVNENGNHYEANPRESHNGQPSPSEGVEEHPGVASKTARSSFTAKRQPKVHHIPILVESRDGAQSVVVTPPATDSPSTNQAPSFRMGAQQQHQQQPPVKQSPPVQAEPPQRRPTYPMPDLTSTAPTRTATPPNLPTSVPNPEKREPNQNDEEAVPLMMADPNKPIPAAAPEPVRNGSKSQACPTPPPTTAPTTTTAAAAAAAAAPSSATAANSNEANTDSVKNKMLEAISRVNEEVEKWREFVLQFSGVKGDKQYMYLDEMLTRCLIALDNVFTEGNDELRAARRAVVVAVNNTIRLLEQKASGEVKVAEQSVVAPDKQNAQVEEDNKTEENVNTGNKLAANVEAEQPEENVKDAKEIEETKEEPKQTVQEGVQENGENVNELDEIIEVTV